MTFEEIHDKIVSGGHAETLEEAAESLAILTNLGGKTDQMIALRIAESYTLFGKTGFASWSMENFGFKTANTVHHRRAVGDMLVALRDRDLRIFKQCLAIEITKLEVLTEIHIKQQSIQAVINFIKLYYTDEMTREELRRVRDQAMGKDRPAGEKEQLQLAFDFIGSEIDEENLQRAIRNDNFDLPHAMLMGYNGASLTIASCRWLEEYREEITPDAIDAIEDLEKNLRATADRLAEALTAQKQRRLGVN